MHITDYPLKEAIKLSLKYIGNGAMNTIFYLSSQVLLDAGENAQQREWLESMDLLLYGEPTVLDVLKENTRERKSEIRNDAFLHEYIKKLARGKQSIYLILDSAEKADSLEGYLKELHPSVNVIGKYIWEEGKEDQPCNPSYFRAQFKKAVGDVEGVRVLTPHCCRHTYVSQMQALGVDLETIQSIVGHADVDMTEHYLHVQEPKRKDAVAKFSEAFDIPQD